MITGLATATSGLGQIVAGFAGKDYALKDGFINAVVNNLGGSEMTGLQLTIVYDLISFGMSVESAAKTAGVTVEELDAFANTKGLAEDVAKAINKYVKSEQDKIKEKQNEEETNPEELTEK